MIKQLSVTTKILTKIGRYGVIGSALNMVGLLVFMVLTHFGVPAKNSLLGVSIALLPFSYYFNRSYVFNVEVDPRRSKVKFFVTYFSILILNLVALDVLLRVTNLDVVLVQVSIFIFLVIINFSLQSKWVFKQSPRDLGI